MATTPLIKTPQADGGTFYTFSSSAKDLSRTLNNDDLKLVFSKFVLLDLPDMDSLPLNFGNYQNYMQYDTIDGAIQNAAISSDPNVNFTQSLQNYMLNIEEMIISDASYDNTTNLTVTERVFFKWLKETGAMRFREATVLEKAGSVTTPRFVEEDQSLSGTREYRPVVKYIGGIDIVNNVDKAGEAYTELYINVPTEVGNTPTILFNSVSDTNYQPGLTIQGTSEFILGRTSATVHPQGLNIKAFYDYDDQLQGLNSAGYTDPAADWMGLGPGVTSPITNAYFTEPVTFTSALNVPIVKYAADYNNPGTYDGSAYERSQLDGISVDFDANDYQQIVTDASISTIPQFNGTALAETFEFNSVLVYYDMVDLSDSTKTTTNLYGILLLDNVTATPSGGFVQRYPKYKPNLTTGQNGNSYGFKINLRFDASPGSAGIDTIINDYNTFSMGLFSDASAQLQTSAQIFQRQQVELANIEIRLAAVENTLNSVSTSAFLQSQINNLQTQVDNASLAFASSTTLLDLISKNSDEIQALANGTVTETLQYNTAVVRQGTGITINTNTPNQIQVSNNVQAYNLMVPLNSSDIQITAINPLNLNVVSPQVFTDLGTYTQMLRLDTINTAGGNLDIYINDTDTQWRTGQTMRLTFNNTLLIGSRNIRLYTDASGRLNNGSYGKLAATIPNTDLSSIPIIDLICTEQGVLTFVYDIVK